MTEAITALSTVAKQSKAVEDKSTLAGDLDTFLHLLTTQLKNQDPLSPMEATEFTGQLVQFAAVEQQIAGNKTMEDLLAVQNASLAASVVGFIGTDIVASGPGLPLQDGLAEYTYTLASNAKATALTILDDKGTIILTKPGETESGVHTATWDGKGSEGQQMPDGSYTVEVTPVGLHDEPIESIVRVRAHITAVNMETGTTVLEAGSVSIPLESVLSVKQATTTATTTTTTTPTTQ
jgi:flagellar basal-body rod modification protein FlgD